MLAAARVLTFLLVIRVFWSHFPVYSLAEKHSRQLEDRETIKIIMIITLLLILAGAVYYSPQTQ